MADKKDAAFEAVIAAYLEAFDAGDYETVASHYADDVVSCPPSGGEIRGIEALTEFYRRTFDEYRPQITGYECEYKFRGGDAIVRESFNVTMNPPGGPPATIGGRGMWVARREGDAWKTYWSIGKTDPLVER